MVLETEPEKCTGCRICESFCSFHHEQAIWLGRSRIRIVAQSDTGPFLIHYCHQCDDAPCAAVCPVEAIALNVQTGAWVVDTDECIGCGECVEACPYEAIIVDEQLGIALKCDLCGGEPECAAMCPTGAIRVAAASS